MIGLTNHRGEGDLQVRKAVGQSGFTQNRHNAIVECVIAQCNGSGSADKGDNDAEIFGHGLGHQADQVLADGIGHTGFVQYAHKDACADYHDYHIEDFACVLADDLALLLQIGEVDGQGEQAAYGEAHSGGD